MERAIPIQFASCFMRRVSCRCVCHLTRHPDEYRKNSRTLAEPSECFLGVFQFIRRSNYLSLVFILKGSQFLEKYHSYLGIESLGRDVLQPLVVGMQSSEEHGRSGLRLRHYLALVSENVPSSVIMVHEQRARFQESCESIGTSMEDVATWTWLKIKTDEANAQTAREQTEWEEVRQSRGGLEASGAS